MQIRNKAITIRVSADEKQWLNEKARRYGLSLSAYLRLSALRADEENEAGYVNAKEGML